MGTPNFGYSPRPSGDCVPPPHSKPISGHEHQGSPAKLSNDGQPEVNPANFLQVWFSHHRKLHPAMGTGASPVLPATSRKSAGQILFLGIIAPLMGTFKVTPLVTNDFVFFETARVCFSR
jgi:hypothetical protein